MRLEEGRHRLDTTATTFMVHIQHSQEPSVPTLATKPGRNLSTTGGTSKHWSTLEYTRVH
eukprot:scaffold10896_cov117-Alexandrium_tamarense.AAC.1